MSRKQIDISSYPRIEHFRHFLAMDHPCASVTVNVDITDFVPRLKAAGFPFFLSFQYAAVRAANRIPEFRQRIVDDGIVEYDWACRTAPTATAWSTPTSPSRTTSQRGGASRPRPSRPSTFRRKATSWAFSSLPASPGSTTPRP